MPIQCGRSISGCQKIEQFKAENFFIDKQIF